ncbi:formate/nitrite transporter family protein [uncultured Tateyamaria sp.]|uniref:formate/nitrite transporter family protein n=1 Tax=uncultured Tateyamaria sp. TaxID=455651 RepID=UPI00261A9A8E|nr:formate/nitrite transporter family protein [uncultured Tateyamaria sp.]
MTHPSTSPLVEEKREDTAVNQATGLSPRLIFETIRRHGEEELDRPTGTLFWSGIAAGILISFSVLGEAYLRTYLPDTDWRFIVENMGYSLGFLLVILGRMQLFTENTITTVVPAVIDPCRQVLSKVAMLWSVVLLSNIIGAFLIATFLVYTPVLSPDVMATVTDLSKHATGFAPLEGLVRGIPAGVLIASIVWMLPSAQNNEVLLIVIFTWLIALGDFTHIIAGSVEMAILAVQGMIGAGQAIFGFFLPVLVGNILGGTAVFTMMTYAQIRPEIDERK